MANLPADHLRSRNECEIRYLNAFSLSRKRRAAIGSNSTLTHAIGSFNKAAISLTFQFAKHTMDRFNNYKLRI